LEKNLGSIADLNRLPSALFVVDVMKEQIAVHEANRLGIPVFAMVDTNSDPSNIDFVIPANDDATKSIDIIVSTVCAAIAEGLEERKIEKADADAAAAVAEEEEGNENVSRRERRPKTARRERIQKEDEEALKARATSKFMKDDDE
jgi:small subunit ribosomal protein S2